MTETESENESVTESENEEEEDDDVKADEIDRVKLAIETQFSIIR